MKKIIYPLLLVAVLTSGIFLGKIIFKSDNVQLKADDNLTRNESNQRITDSRENAITQTVKNASSSVVGINVTEIREYRDPFGDIFGNDPFFRQFFGDRSFKQEVHGLGSGFIVSEDGYIITNDHVIGNATKVVVSLTNGEHIDAEIIGKDPVSDIAVLKINRSGLPYVKFGNSDDVIIGEWVIALGNPFGLFEVNQKPTVTVGVISATNMKLSPVQNRFYRNMIQTDAAINSGNSGGPLLNSSGEVIGMNTLIYTGNTFASGNIGLGFAIPINKVRLIFEALKKDGRINRDFDIGLRVQTVDQNIAAYFKLKNVTGVIVVSVEKNSAADREGIQQEDIITALNGENISSDADFWGIIADMRKGDVLKMKILRKGETLEKAFNLELK
ncbi:MAG: trypsin-like peptidase domain-containing protein [Ignavibacteria bacterium]|nr:trypsin-like peptidase domain-containing protein [Ignavibacteria bacterium]